MQSPLSVKSQSSAQMQMEKSDTEEDKEKQNLKKTSIIDYDPSLSDNFQPLSRVISYYNNMSTLIKVKKADLFIYLILLLLQLQLPCSSMYTNFCLCFESSEFFFSFFSKFNAKFLSYFRRLYPVASSILSSLFFAARFGIWQLIIYDLYYNQPWLYRCMTFLH